VADRRRWDKHDIKAAIHRTGMTLASVAQARDLSDSTVRAALLRPQYAGEQAIADFLGVPAPVLWPERYGPDGARRLGRHRHKHIGSAALSQRQSGAKR